MTTDSQQVVRNAWNLARVLRDEGQSSMAYIEPIAFLLFLKAAGEPW